MLTTMPRGAVAIRFNLRDTSLLFIDAYLDNSGKALASQVTQVHQLLFQQEAVGKKKE
jgi:hypothetical protein